SNESSHLQLHNEKFKAEFMSKYVIESQNEFEEILKNDPLVKAFSSRLVVNAMIASSHSSTGLKVLGIDPVEETKTTSLPKKIKEGQYFQASKRNQIIISQKTADKLKL